MDVKCKQLSIRYEESKTYFTHFMSPICLLISYLNQKLRKCMLTNVQQKQLPSSSIDSQCTSTLVEKQHSEESPERKHTSEKQDKTTGESDQMNYL